MRNGKGKGGRPWGSSVMPADNDWRVLCVIIRAILRANRRPVGKSPDSEVSCALSFADIGEGSGVCPTNVHTYVRRLEERSLLRRERTPGTSPTIYYMTLSTLGAAHVLLDTVVGMDSPWPDRDTCKH